MDLSNVPISLEDLHGIQMAQQISQSNLPDLTAEEELAIQAFSKLFKHDNLDISIRVIMDVVSDQMSGTWDIGITQRELRATMLNNTGAVFQLATTCPYFASLTATETGGALSKTLAPLPLEFISVTLPVHISSVPPANGHYLPDTFREFRTLAFSNFVWFM